MDKARHPLAEDKLSQNSTSGAKETVAKMLQRSEEFKKKGQIEQTLRILNTLVTYNTNTEKIYLSRAEIYRQKNQLSLALADLTRVIDMGTVNVEAYAQRAEVYRALNQPKKALGDLNEALTLDPDNIQLLGKRGTFYRSLNKFSHALKDYNHAIELDSDSAWLYGNRAETYRALSEHRKALNDYNKTIKLNPTATWVYERRSYSNLWLGYINAAQADFQKSWELNPRNLKNGWMAEWTGMYRKEFVFSAEVVKKLDSIAATDPKHPLAYLCRAMISIRRGDFSGSYKFCEAAIKLAPEEPGAYFWKAMAACGLKQDKEAFDLLQTALDLNLRPIFLPPPAWIGEINPAFYDKLSQHLFHKPVSKPLETGAELEDDELDSGFNLDEQLGVTEKAKESDILASAAKPQPKLVLVKTPAQEPVQEPAQEPAQEITREPGTAQAVAGKTITEPGEAAEPASLPVNALEALQNVNTAAAENTLPAKAALTGQLSDQAVSPAITGDETAAEPDEPTSPKKKEKGLFSFFKVFTGMVGLLVVRIFV